MADADPYTAEFRANVLANRFQPVVACKAAAGLDLDLAGRKVELVVKDDDIGGRELVEPHRFADCFAGIVHVGLRLQRQRLLAGDFTLAQV